MTNIDGIEIGHPVSFYTPGSLRAAVVTGITAKTITIRPVEVGERVRQPNNSTIRYGDLTKPFGREITLRRGADGNYGGKGGFAVLGRSEEQGGVGYVRVPRNKQ